MIVRMLGSDAEVEFPEGAADAVKRLEERFPCPEWAVVYAEAELDEEDGDDVEPDELIVCRRYNGVLLQMAFIGLDEIVEMDAEEGDWIADLAEDLAMTEEEVDAMIEQDGDGAQ